MLRSVGLRAFLAALLAILIVGGGAVAAVYLLAQEESADRSARAALESAYRAYATLEMERYKRLSLAASKLASAPEIVDLVTAAAEAPEEGDPESPADLPISTVQTILAGERAGLGEGMAAVLDLSGQTLVATNDLPNPGDLAETEAVRRATQRASRRGDAGVWVVDDRFYYLAVEPIVQEFERLGLVVTLLPVDELTGEEVRPPRGDVVFLAASPRGVDPVAGTLSTTSATEVLEALGPELTRLGGFGRVLDEGDSIDDVSVQISDRSHQALLAPVRAASDQGSGTAVLFLAPRMSAASARLEALAIVGAAALVALLLAYFLSRWVGRGTRRPIGQLEKAVEAGRRGRFAAAQDLPDGSGAFAGLATAFRGWMTELQQQRELRDTVSEAVSAVGEGGPGSSRGAATRDEAALLAIDLRGYARAMDADRDVERFHGDLDRIRHAVRDRGGRVEAVAGHRILAAFQGLDDTDRALAALAAGAQIRRVLTRPTSAFDDVEDREPPTLALASGKVIAGAGSPGLGGRLSLGLPIQMLETLLREAAPGQILLSRDVRQALSGALDEAGVQPVSQRGLLTPQPLFELTPEAAAQVTGLDSPGGEVLAGFQIGAAAAGLPEPGETLADRFEIREVVGTGPLGTVYRAYDREFGREVAFKAFRREALRAEDRLNSLDSPLGTLRPLAHPSVARTYDFGVAAGLRFLTRQLVPGLNLRRLVERSGPLSLAAALGAGRQMASALATAHDGELFHGRLKPENVIFESGGSVVLTDFGCVFLAAPGLDLDSSASGYLAPEQEHGEPGDARTDVYVWGLLVYDLVTGRIPTLGERIERRKQEADMPEGIQHILGRCLTPEPDGRYPDGAALLEALAGLSE